MKRVKHFIVGVLVLASRVFGQAPAPTNYQLAEQPLPIVTQVGVRFSGVAGNTTYCYWVVARYAVGNSGMSAPSCIGALGTGTVTITWQLPNIPNTPNYALSYDVIRTSSNVFNQNCVNCLVTGATTSLSTTDSLGVLASPYNATPYGLQNAVTSVDNTSTDQATTYTTFHGAKNQESIRSGTVLPTYCNNGDFFILTSAVAGSNIYACINNAWAVQGGGGGANNVFVVDSDYATLQLACSAATTGKQLLITKEWLNTPTINMNTCRAEFIQGGKIVMAAGAVLTTPVPLASPNQWIIDTVTNTASVVWTGSGFLQHDWLGADGTYATSPETARDSTAYIQAIYSSATQGRPIIGSIGTYKITGPIYGISFNDIRLIRTEVKSGINLQGTVYDYQGVAPASPFLADGGVVNFVSTYGAKFSGGNFIGNGKSISGIMIYSDGVSPSQRNRVEDTIFQGFGSAQPTQVDGACLVGGIGPSGINQADGVRFRGFHCYNSDRGVRINTPNFDYSEISGEFVFNTVNQGVDIIYAGSLVVDNGAGGPFYGANPCFACVHGAYDAFTISRTAAEADFGTGLPAEHITVDASVSTAVPIMVANNHIDFPIGIRGTSIRIDSSGNSYGGTVTLSGAAVSVTSNGDKLASAPVKSGVGANWNYATTPGADTSNSATYVSNNNTRAGYHTEFRQDATSLLTETGNLFSVGTGSPQQKWEQIFGIARFGWCNITASLCPLVITQATNTLLSNTTPDYTFTNDPTNLTLFGTTAFAANKGAGIQFGGFYNGSSQNTFAYIGGVKETATSGDVGGLLLLGVRGTGSGGADMTRFRINGTSDMYGIVGARYGCTRGSNSACGVVTLAAGTATVNTSAIGALAVAGGNGYAVRLTYQTCSSCGTLSTGAVVVGTSFVINSSNAGDTSNVFYEVFRIF